MKEINAHALIVAKGSSQKGFKAAVDHHRKLGFTDAEIVKAMAGSRELISAKRTPGSNGKERRDPVTVKDRAAVAAKTLIPLVLRLAESPDLYPQTEALLRDELADAVRQAIADLPLFD
jgi:hypothetical protein